MDARRRGELERVHARIAHRFGRAETRERVKHYLTGLTEESGRRTGRLMSERMQEARQDGAQRLLNAARWDADAVRDDLREYVVEGLSNPRGGLVLVEAAFRKKGARSAGVARQLDPSTGRVHNCQVGLFLAYASPRGRAFIDRELYLPEGWAGDAERRRAAGVPGEVRYATQEDLAQAMLERAFEAGVPAAWVAGGEPCGESTGARSWLQASRLPYALARRFRGPGDAAALPRRTWREIRKSIATWRPISGGAGSWDGSRMYSWRHVSQGEEAAGAQTQWLVLRRWTDASRLELAHYRADGFGRMALAELAGAAATHEAVEDDLVRARGRVGLGEYEVRGWDAWYRHVTLCLRAHAALRVARAR